MTRERAEQRAMGRVAHALPGAGALLAAALIAAGAPAADDYPSRTVTAPGLTDVMSGEVTMMFADLGPTLPLVADGKLKLIAVTTLARSPQLPAIPTVAETLPGYDAVGWQGLLARSGTPAGIITRLNRALVPELATPATAERFRTLGIDVRSGSPEDFRIWIAAEHAKWGKVIRAAGLVPP